MLLVSNVLKTTAQPAAALATHITILEKLARVYSHVVEAPIHVKNYLEVAYARSSNDLSRIDRSSSYSCS